tara:strand:- start:1279 stop:1584 length:306 start_codon:yes stop_codon:yes gene_type:complete
MVGCRTSGVILADGVAVGEGCKLISIHATSVATATTIYVFDSNTTATGTEIARINLAANQTIEFDMHGVICKHGVFVAERALNAAIGATTGGAMAVTIEYV